MKRGMNGSSTLSSGSSAAFPPDESEDERKSGKDRGMKTNKKKAIPSILRCWRWLNHATRPLLPGNFSLTVVTFLFLTCLRFAFTKYLQVQHGWPTEVDVVAATDKKHPTIEAAASLVATVHSVLLVPGLLASFLSHSYSPSERLANAPVWWQESSTALIQFCTGYMLYDGLWNILVLHYPAYEPSDWMFLGHHLATIIYMSSARYVGAGASSAMMCMLLGESTNPLQNLYYVSQYGMALDCCNGARMQVAHRVLEIVFSACYVFVRAVVGPFVCLHMTYKLAAGREVPTPLKTVWILLIWGVMIGSIPWIQDCWASLQRHANLSPAGSNEL
jgi:TLC domain